MPGSDTIALPGQGPGTADRPSTFGGLRALIAPSESLGATERIAERLDGIIARFEKPEDAEAEIRAELIRMRDASRARVREGLLENPFAGLRVARAYAHVTDLVVYGIWQYARRCHPLQTRTTGEQLSIVAVGGYGRGEMAPFSDVDLLFLTPWKPTARSESMHETMFYLLTDMGLRLGQSIRSVDDCLAYAASDITIRTSLLEKRFICGEPSPFDTLDERLWDELFLKTGPDFVQAKLRERDVRHEQNGGSRYLLEPNVKESKGGLRDLQTLHWISKYLYRTGTAWDLVVRGVFKEEEVQRFAEAAKFLWAARCHLHDLTGRAQERLTFDRQVEIAERMGFERQDGRRGVERFMHTYFRHAKNVGDLTRIFSAALEAQHAKPAPILSSLFRALTFRAGQGTDGPFVVRDGRLGVVDEKSFVADPLNLLRLFHEAARLDAQLHPDALRLVTRNLHLVDDALRHDRQANRLFMEMLTDRKHAAWLLRRMNETDLLGRFVPEFGRAVAMMQFNMYHHYTVDEHTIQAISVMNRIERLEEQEAHPVATDIVRAGVNRRVIYTALLFHDLGKGAGRDHSEYGAELALNACPRLGLDEAETEMVAWLVRHHLLMSDMAQKRDIGDPGTVQEFIRTVQSPERLRQLLVLTVCDIRGVGPNVWNNWKAQLLRKLYHDARDLLTGAVDRASQTARLEVAQDALRERLADWPEERVNAELGRHYPGYWLGLDTDTHQIFAELAGHADPEKMTSRFCADAESDVTKVCIYMADHPGVFSRMAGAFALAAANLVDARTYTTADGMVCAVFWIQDAEGKPFEEARLKRLKRTIERIMKGEVVARDALNERRRERPREATFTVPTRILFDNEGSDLYTVIEVNARDRLGLLHVLTRTLTGLNVNIFSAIIATYGEHAVDVFYVKDIFGLKIRSRSKQEQIERHLREAIDGIRAVGS